MTATISGDGTSTLINLTTSGNTILGDASTDTLNVGNGGLVKDASGNVGIATASPGATLDLRGTYRQVQATDAQALNSLTQLTLQRNGNDSRLAFGYTTSNSAWNITASYGSTGAYAPLAFSTSDTERMRIDTSGILGVGTTGGSTGNNTNSFSAIPAAGGGYILVQHASGSASGFPYAYFSYNTTVIGSISQNGTTAVAYNTTSDYRLKENVQPLAGALSRIAALKPCTYTWKSAPDEIGEGFIAHELAEVCPQAVTGEKDALNEDGSIKPQSIDTSFLVATLTAAIQEQQAIITSLTDRITALEAKS